jgi:hypothetical protein
MTVVLLLILAGIPLLGVVWIVLFGAITTVDGLFMSLILLAMSGIVGTTALFELRHRISGSGRGGSSSANKAGLLSDGKVLTGGKVREVVFFESNVGEPNKSIVTLSRGESPQTLVLEGDMRNALPVGQTVAITLRKENGSNVLVNVSYS